MGDVFLAVIEGPQGMGFTKLAVVKRLRQHLAEDPEFIGMLMDEARLTARLSHPNVVQLFEVGEDDGHYFLAMEHLDGQPLNRIERQSNRSGVEVPREVHYAVVADALAGLHHAHELADFDGTPLRVVHRDVTPHNVFVTYHGAVKVVDFGIAKAANRSVETQQGVVKGKVRYMSPEQARGDAVDRRTDIFAAGVMLWHAATGARLWDASEEYAVVRDLVAGNYNPSPKAVREDVPDEIDRICRKALAFDRNDRYATAEEMRADIETFLGGRSSAVRAQLAPLLQSLFAKERAKLKVVLESSALPAPLDADAEVDRASETDAATLVMTARMARPMPTLATAEAGPPSSGRPAPVALAASGSVDPASLSPLSVPPQTGEDRLVIADQARARRRLPVIAAAATLAVAASVALFALLSSSSEDRSAAAAIREPAALGADRQEFATVTLTRATSASTPTAPTAHPVAEPPAPAASPAPRTRVTVRRAPRGARATSSSQPPTAAPSSARPTGAAGTRQELSLDNGDPWGAPRK